MKMGLVNRLDRPNMNIIFMKWTCPSLYSRAAALTVFSRSYDMEQMLTVAHLQGFLRILNKKNDEMGLFTNYCIFSERSV